MEKALRVTLARLLVLFVVINFLVFDVPSLAGENRKVKATKLTISMDLPPTNDWVMSFRKFAEDVKAKTNGAVDVQVFDSAALGTQREALEGMLVGTMNGTVALEPLTYWIADIDIFSIPYLFEDQEHLQKFLDGPYGKELEDKIIATGFRPITYFMRPPRQITSKRAINSVDDIAGLKIRVPETKAGPAAFEAMGAKPVTMPYSEVYSALEQGVIEAQENPLNQIISSRFYEVQPFLALTNHQFQIAYMLLDERTFSSFDEETKKIIYECAADAKKFDDDLVNKQLDECMQILANNKITITRPNNAEFAAKAKEAYRGYEPLMQEWIAKVQK